MKSQGKIRYMVLSREYDPGKVGNHTYKYGHISVVDMTSWTMFFSGFSILSAHI